MTWEGGWIAACDSGEGPARTNACPLSKPLPLIRAALAARFDSAGARAGFSDRGIRRRSADAPFSLSTKRTPGPRPRIYLSAGIHGDEPAPPLALLALIESGALDKRAVWFLCPILNPDGLARGTRENAEGVDLNRDYRHLGLSRDPGARRLAQAPAQLRPGDLRPRGLGVQGVLPLRAEPRQDARAWRSR